MALTSTRSVDVIQIGAREHYAVPLMMERLGLLRAFHTDIYAGRGSWIYPLSVVAGPLARFDRVRKMLGRRCDLPARKVFAHNFIGFVHHVQLRCSTGQMEAMHANHRIAREIDRAYLRSIASPADATIGFRGSDYLFEQLAGRTLRVLDQIDGGIHEVRVVHEELCRYRESLPQEFWTEGTESSDAHNWLDIELDRLRREWSLSDRIVCNSEWTKTCLGAEGVDTSKCRVIPLAYESHGKPAPSLPNHHRRRELRVGFLGTLTIRKGIHLLCKAIAQANETAAVTLVCAGPEDRYFTRAHLERFKPYVEYMGTLPRDRIGEFMDRIDVLALPSVSEGFGIVQLEAMAHGKPVISSERTGEVVEHGHNGLRVSAGNMLDLANAIVRLAVDHELLRHLSAHARPTLERFTHARVAELWHDAVEL